MAPSSEMDAPRREDAGKLDMPAAAMRELADRAVELIIARIRGLGSDRPWRGASRAELEPLLREPPPEQGHAAREVLERAVREVLPLAARVDHPRFFAFVPSAPTWPGVIADFLTAGFNIFQGTWLGAAGPSQLELVVIDWFRQWVGYPATAGGLFTSGGSAAILDALVAARERHGAPARPAIFMSDQTHSAVERAARIIGVSNASIMARHLLPNIFGPLSVAATFYIAQAILLESALSFLGLGVKPPTPSWGNMVNQAQSAAVLQLQPWTWVFPALAIALVVLAINFIGDGLRDALDPRSARKA